MTGYFAIIVTLIWVTGCCLYIYKIIKHKISPTLSTWIIFSVATGLSLSSYLVASNINVLDGVLVVVDTVTCFSVFISIIIFTNSKLRIEPFERYYLIGTGLVVIFWMVTKNAFIVNLIIQFLIVVGYFPTIQNIICSKKNLEPFTAWIFILLAAIVSIYPLLVAGGNTLAIIYSIRTIVMSSILLFLMAYFRSKDIKKS